MEKMYLLPESVGQRVLEYLAIRPYREVFPLVRELESLQPMPEEGEIKPEVPSRKGKK